MQTLTNHDACHTPYFNMDLQHRTSTGDPTPRHVLQPGAVGVVAADVASGACWFNLLVQEKAARRQSLEGTLGGPSSSDRARAASMAMAGTGWVFEFPTRAYGNTAQQLNGTTETCVVG